VLVALNRKNEDKKKPPRSRDQGGYSVLVKSIQVFFTARLRVGFAVSILEDQQRIF